MTVIQLSHHRAKKEKPLGTNITTDINEMAEIQSRVNAHIGVTQRATKKQALIAKIMKNLESQLKSVEKLEALKVVESDLKKQLDDIENAKKKAERAAEAKAKRDEKAKAEKELMKVIKKSGLSAEEVKANPGI